MFVTLEKNIYSLYCALTLKILNLYHWPFYDAVLKWKLNTRQRIRLTQYNFCRTLKRHDPLRISYKIERKGNTSNVAYSYSNVASIITMYKEILSSIFWYGAQRRGNSLNAWGTELLRASVSPSFNECATFRKLTVGCFLQFNCVFPNVSWKLQNLSTQHTSNESHIKRVKRC